MAVVGAGAAGLMTAVTCRRAGLRVLLLDGREKIGAKILISGGTRCNLTNLEVTEKDFQSESLRMVSRILQAFPSSSAVQFFRGLGVEVTLEQGGKFFPVTHSAKTVLDAFLKECERLGVRLETGRKVTGLSFDKDLFTVSGQGFSYSARAVVLCTGGLSYPSTGSDGTGYEIAKAAGHKLVFTTPALTPLLTDDQDLKNLSGIALPARLTLIHEKKKEAMYEGPLLFTHFGFSGPAALNMSRHWIRQHPNGLAKGGVRLLANFLPAMKEDSFRDEILSASRQFPARLVKSFLAEKFPERFAEIFLKKTGLPPSLVLNQLKRAESEKLLQALFHFPLSVIGALGYIKAEVTAGGVDIREMDPRTLESKHRSGLFFAGEILDVDGRIGGFNFQWAWSSGVAAACGVIKKFKHEAKNS